MRIEASWRIVFGPVGSVTQLVYDSCGVHEAADVLDALDQEFVFGKGRRTSVVRRYPHVFGARPERSLRLVRSEGGWVACAAVRRVGYRLERSVLQAAMIGFVYSRPEFRGRGAGSILMRELGEELRGSGVDFGILWSGIPAFYARLGWLSADTGILGQTRGYAAGVDPGGVSTTRSRCDAGPAVGVNDIATEIAVGSPSSRAAEELRGAVSVQGVVREPAAYGAVPLPGDGVCFVAETDVAGRLLAYAIVGLQARVGCVYDMIGEDSARRKLVARMMDMFDRVVINDTATSSIDKITAGLGFSWTPQRLAMVLPLTPVAEECVAQVHVPWFDRI